MNWELDHVFFATPDLAMVERTLSNKGLKFTRHVVHPGQGTANACAVFRNAFFEVLGMHDVDELKSELVHPLALWERIQWAETGACPLGVCYRASDGKLDVGSLPFEGWHYKPAYLSSGASIPIVTPRRALTEPLIFLSADPDRRTNLQEAAARHGETRTLTGVALRRPSAATPLSDGVRWFENQGLLSIEDGPNYSIELEWDHGREGICHRFSDEVPLVFRW
jgi:hypothetical protein